ncbi:MAG: polyribonucleotide nucleotidyltransferase [Actinobacteria bacterium]|nr:polyribonucleotide nucleotidyltransferase [Actinomycetota bacterium]
MEYIENKCEVSIGDRTITFFTGRLARQADGTVLVKCGGNGVLVTAVMNENPVEGVDFAPLTVDVEERMYAAGKIPGGFFKREGRASEKAILISRLTDRPLRPLFPKNMRNEVQIIATVLSVDQINPYDILVMNGASMALCISDIPFNGPVGSVRVARVDDRWVFNPVFDEIEKSVVDIVVAGTENAILMVEASGKEADEEIVLEAIERAHPEIKKIIEVQKRFAEDVGKRKKEFYSFEIKSEIKEKVREIALDKIQQRLDKVIEYSGREDRDSLLSGTKKGYFQDEMRLVQDEVVKKLEQEFPSDVEAIKGALKELERELVREMILERNIRPDGRKPSEIRRISCEVGLFPGTTHGTGLFTRGRTQVLTILALGSIKEAQRIDTLEEEEEFKRFIHHYNFPPYSTGETWPLKGPRRREIGHGALAERALKPMIPPEDTFPYALRLVSEVLESNGSTSMASVCGSTLALMDAGVPIKNPVSGIAMGLVKEGDRFVVLSDIQGIEDFYGDMDFKVAGTKNGITALQMDIKIEGISIDIIREALQQAREGRLYILSKMLEVIPGPREKLADNVPKITIFKIPREKIGEIIGPGGRNVKSIKEEFKLDEIELYDFNGEGVVSITCSDSESIKMARKRIETMLKDIDDIKEGEEFLGTVVGITSYGAFVNLIPGVDGLLHISKITGGRINRVEDYLKVGDRVLVRIASIGKNRRIALERVDVK